MTDYLKRYPGTPTYRDAESSVHFSDFRINKAREEAKKQPVPVARIIELTNEFLQSLDIPPVENPRLPISDLLPTDFANIDYAKIKSDYRLADERDLVWMKFTEDGYLGVVASSSDINFNYPPSSENYNDRTPDGKWRYFTAGIILHSLDKSWDKSFVLAFPLKDLPEDLHRTSVERGVGNYLIAHSVPILDFYSHNSF